MARNLQQNVGLGLIIFSVLGLLAVLINSQLFALSTGGFQGISYATFESNAIDNSKFKIGPTAPRNTPQYADSRACQVEQGASGDYENGRLSMRGCPLETRDLTGKLVYLQVEALKDFYGQDVRILANIVEGTGYFYVGDFGTGHFAEVSDSTGGENRVVGNTVTFVPSGQSRALLEVIPSELDPTQVKIFVNGQQSGQLSLLQTEKLSIGFMSKTGYVTPQGESQPGRFDILQFNYEPQFGCDIRNGELLVTQTLVGGQSIDIHNFEFDVIRFCPDLPAIIIDQQAQGSTTSVELLRRLKLGQSYFIPEQQNIEFKYVMRNDDGSGQPIVPFICTNETYNFEKKQCEPKIGTLVLCDGQLVDGDCLLRVDTILECEEEGATLREDGTCVKRIPSTQVACEANTMVLGEDGVTCQPRSDTCEIGYTRKEISADRFECVSNTKPETFSSTTNDIVSTAVQTTQSITGEKDNKSAIQILLGTLFVIVLIIGLLLYFTSKRI